MDTRWIKYIVNTAGGLLFAAALIRFMIATGSAQALALPDPLLGIPLRLGVLLAGVIELAIAVYCLFGRQLKLKVGCLAWMATNVVVFHAGLIWLKVHPQGTMLGSLTDPMQLNGTIMGFVTGLLPVAFVAGSYAAAVGVWLMSRRGELVKTYCPSCGGHIRFAVENLGQKISCPHCRKNVTLHKSEDTLKISCVFCGQHIEFPCHAVGERIPCPHCRRNVTLKET